MTSLMMASDTCCIYVLLHDLIHWHTFNVDNSIFICIHGIFPSISLDQIFTFDISIIPFCSDIYIYISVLSQSIIYFLKPNIYWYDHVNYNPSKNLISSGNRTNFSVESCLTSGHMNFCYHNVSIVNFSTF